jgi:hypothetical protein
MPHPDRPPPGFFAAAGAPGRLRLRGHGLHRAVRLRPAGRPRPLARRGLLAHLVKPPAPAELAARLDALALRRTGGAVPAI